MSGALVWCPFADEDAARTVASQLLDERLCACANIVPGMVSLFRWNGERGESREAGVLFKTAAAHRDALVRRLDELHPYDSPAIMSWKADPGSAAISQWLAETTARGAER